MLAVLAKVEVAKILQTSLRSRPTTAIFTACVRGEILNNLGRYREAADFPEMILPLTREALAAEPENHENLYRLSLALDVTASAYWGLGEEQLAFQRWGELVRALQPVGASTDLLYLQDLLARALLRLGKVEEAGPVVKGLLTKQWRHRDFPAFVAEYGLGITEAP